MHTGPRERLLQLGEPRLSDSECLALILRTGTRELPVEQLATRLLQEFGGLESLAATPVRELATVPGIGPARAAALHAAFGLARRLSEHRFQPGRRICKAEDIARIVRDTTRGSGRETFFVILLDARHRVLGVRPISTGDLCGAPVHPREVFLPAIRESAASIVVAHNHPSGDATPSDSDHGVTERLRDVGVLVGIELLDHVVVGASSYYSFADRRASVIRSDRR